MNRSIWIGFDPREQDAFNVCVTSIRQHLSVDIPIYAVPLAKLQSLGIYTRPITRLAGGQLYDPISKSTMSTEFAISRFLVPHLAHDSDWALFMDCDMLVRADLAQLFDCADARYAVQVVKHNYQPSERIKMDGQAQTSYPRKNWSSVVLWNLRHRGNARLRLETINRNTGRFLHRFGWLMNSQIGSLDPSWNHLVGVDQPDPDARIAHFTLGVPSMAGYRDCEFADEWRAVCQPVPA